MELNKREKKHIRNILALIYIILWLYFILSIIKNIKIKTILEALQLLYIYKT